MRAVIFMKKTLCVFIVMVGLLGIFPAGAQSLLATDSIDASLNVASFRYENGIEKPGIESRLNRGTNG